MVLLFGYCKFYQFLHNFYCYIIRNDFFYLSSKFTHEVKNIKIGERDYIKSVICLKKVLTSSYDKLGSVNIFWEARVCLIVQV